MRENLARYANTRLAVQGTVVREGVRLAGHATFPTLLLSTLTTPEGSFLADHCWIALTRKLKELALQPGDILACLAHVRQYRKGYLGTAMMLPWTHGVDYTLERLEQCACVQRAIEVKEPG